MRKNVNKINVEGYLFDFNIKEFTVQNEQSESFGKPYMRADLSIATDEEGLNVITVHYPYVAESFASGKDDSRFSRLKKIQETEATWIKNGKEGAMKLQLTPSAAINDFYSTRTNQMVSAQRAEGGFINLVTGDFKTKNEGRRKFTLDVIIFGATLVEADPEKNITEDYVKINCVAFDYLNNILPYTLVAKTQGAMNYFLGLEPSKSNPIYTQVWGEIVSTTVKYEKVTENAFGEPSVDVVESKRTEWIITGATPDTYVFDDESTITAEELNKAIADRNIKLEEIKTKALEDKKDTVPVKNAIPAPKAKVPEGGFDF